MKPSQKKTASPAGSGSHVDWAEVNRVLDFMSLNNLEEFDYASGDLRIHLRKPGGGGPALVPVVAATQAPAVTAAPAGGGTPAAAVRATAEPVAEERTDEVNV